VETSGNVGNRFSHSNRIAFNLAAKGWRWQASKPDSGEPMYLTTNPCLSNSQSDISEGWTSSRNPNVAAGGPQSDRNLVMAHHSLRLFPGHLRGSNGAYQL
jgi:hypothetical protein